MTAQCISRQPCSTKGNWTSFSPWQHQMAYQRSFFLLPFYLSIYLSIYLYLQRHMTAKRSIIEEPALLSAVMMPSCKLTKEALPLLTLVRLYSILYSLQLVKVIFVTSWMNYEDPESGLSIYTSPTETQWPYICYLLSDWLKFRNRQDTSL